MCTLFTNSHVHFEATERLELIIEFLVLTNETQNSQYHIFEEDPDAHQSFEKIVRPQKQE